MFKDTSGDAGQTPSELDLLKQKARLMGVEFSNNIGLETLKERIRAKEVELASQDEREDAPEETNQEELVQEDPQPLNTEATAAPTLSVEDMLARLSKDDLSPEALNKLQSLVGFQPNALEASAALAMDKVAAPVSKPKSKKQSLRQRLYQENMRLVRCRIQNLDPKKANLPGEIFTVANEYLGTVRKFVPYGEVTDDGFHIPYWVYKQLVKREFLNIRTRKDKRTGTDIVETKWAREFAIEILPPLAPDELENLKQAQIAAGSIE